MSTRPHHAHRPPSFFNLLWMHKLVFSIVLVIVVWISLGTLYALGLLPDELIPQFVSENVPTLAVIDEVPVFPEAYGPRYVFANAGGDIVPVSPSTPTQQPPTVIAGATQKPVRIVIEKIGVDTKVLNPESQKVSALDEALKSGVVRYPGSGIPGQGNMFVFGHSTSFRVVQNQAYKAFNNLDKLVAGDVVSVYTTEREYRYRVETVTLVSEEQGLVDLSGRNTMLTLSTCNTFGRKQDRHVVEAEYLGSQAI